MRFFEQEESLCELVNISETHRVSLAAECTEDWLRCANVDGRGDPGLDLENLDTPEQNRDLNTEKWFAQASVRLALWCAHERPRS
jgi:hypothetical protein